MLGSHLSSVHFLMLVLCLMSACTCKQQKTEGPAQHRGWDKVRNCWYFVPGPGLPFWVWVCGSGELQLQLLTWSLRPNTVAKHPLKHFVPSQATDTKLELILGKCFWISLKGLIQALKFEVTVNNQNFATTGSIICMLNGIYCVSFSRTEVLPSFRLNWMNLY